MNSLNFTEKELQAKKDSGLGDKVKKSNFEYGGKSLSSQVPYCSMTVANFNKKGDNYAALKATLDTEKKSDLRNNHFDIGGPSARITTSMQQMGFRPNSAKQIAECRPHVDQKLKNDLRSSHWSHAAPSQQGRPPASANWVSSNMLTFKWYQPAAQK